MIRYLSTVLTVSFVVTLRMESPCSLESRAFSWAALRAPSSQELHKLRLREP